MLRLLALLTPVLVLIPLDAYACINSMRITVTERFATQPPEFLHFGLFAAALVLLAWRGQPRPGDSDVEAQPTIPRQFAVLAVALVGSFGLGVIFAEAIAFNWTTLTVRAMWALGLVVAALGVTVHQTGSRVRVMLRRVALGIAAIIALGGLTDVLDGELARSETVSAWEHNAEITGQVTF